MDISHKFLIYFSNLIINHEDNYVAYLDSGSTIQTNLDLCRPKSFTY